MSFMDRFKGIEHKERAEALAAEVERMRESMTDEMRDADAARAEIARLDAARAAAEERLRLAEDAVKAARELGEGLDAAIAKKRAQIVTFDDAILVQDFGLYEPRFDFATSTQYKGRLERCRSRQREMLKDLAKGASDTTWTVNGSAAQGRKMAKEVSKLIMRAYNGECDEVVRKVKTTNVDKSIEHVYKAAETVNKLGATLGISVPMEYAALKEEEVRLAYEFAMVKEREREELRLVREEERERRKVEREIAAERKKLEKEQEQHIRARADLLRRLKDATGGERDEIARKIDEMDGLLRDIEKAIVDVDYREANQRAGYVYVISNIGSFGEGVYKIGMTRRLDPMDRIRELGDASVPFNFDVHALIFAEDAPALEAALHREFESRKVNMINTRREFFQVSLEEIEDVVKRNYDKTVEFTEIPDAEQYRMSVEMRAVDA